MGFCGMREASTLGGATTPAIARLGPLYARYGFVARFATETTTIDGVYRKHVFEERDLWGSSGKHG